MSIQTPGKSVPVKGAEAAGQRLGQSRVFELSARLGFVARGVICGVIGIFAVELVFALYSVSDARYRRV